MASDATTRNVTDPTIPGHCLGGLFGGAATEQIGVSLGFCVLFCFSSRSISCPGPLHRRQCSLHLAHHTRAALGEAGVRTITSPAILHSAGGPKPLRRVTPTGWGAPPRETTPSQPFPSRVQLPRSWVRCHHRRSEQSTRSSTTGAVRTRQGLPLRRVFSGLEKVTVVSQSPLPYFTKGLVKNGAFMVFQRNALCYYKH